MNDMLAVGLALGASLLLGCGSEVPYEGDSGGAGGVSDGGGSAGSGGAVRPTGGAGRAGAGAGGAQTGSGGGIWKSTDCAGTWTKVSTGKNSDAVNNGMQWSIVVDPVHELPNGTLDSVLRTLDDRSARVTMGATPTYMRTVVRCFLLSLAVSAASCGASEEVLQSVDGGPAEAGGRAGGVPAGGTGGTAGLDAATGSGGWGTGADSGGVIVDSAIDRPQLLDCVGLVCGSGEQGVKVRSPALGTIQCACVPISSTGRCVDCSCGASLCAQLGAICAGFSLEGGLLCTQPG
jgi:hypothetical protein